MLCRAVPYEGNEPYIFLSYCHKDAGSVYPLLEQMVRDGYRIWYDEGNHPGDDWPDNIARHLENAEVILAMISEASSNSHNCKNELNFAIGDLGKRPVAILLEEFTMPLGMRMQFSSTHYIKKTDYPSQHSLLEKLYRTAALAPCHAAPGSLAMREVVEPVVSEPVVREPVVSEPVVREPVVSEPVVHEPVVSEPVVREPVISKAVVTETVVSKPVQEEPQKAKVKATRVKVKTKEKPAKSVVKTEPAAPQPEPAVEAIKPEQEQVVSFDRRIESVADTPVDEVDLPLAPDSNEDDDGVTVYDYRYSGQNDGADDDETPTQFGPEQQDMVLVRVSAGKAYMLQSMLNRIGRSEQKCDVVLSGNPSISGSHAEIIQYNSRCYLRDLNSTNGTFVNGQKLSAEEKVQLSSGDQFYLEKEAFVFFSGPEAKTLINQGRVLYLRNVNTGAVRVLLEDELWLDRGHKWADGTLNDEKVSRKFKHAVIVRCEDGFVLEDKGSTNGTFINGKDLRGQPPVQIKETDRIRLGDTILEVGMAAF